MTAEEQIEQLEAENVALRGQLAEALEKLVQALGRMHELEGQLAKDRWVSYDYYKCAHSIFGAHLVRDCIYVREQEKQPWARWLRRVLSLDPLMLMRMSYVRETNKLSAST
jgi:hypothetical protein